MIHPEHIDGVAQDAYERFRAACPTSGAPKREDFPEWADLPELTHNRWRDNVVAADRVRNKVTDTPQERCCFEAVSFYHAFGVKEPAAVPQEYGKSSKSRRKVNNADS